MVSHARTRFVRRAAGSHAGGGKLLPVSTPDRTAVLCSGPQFIPGISSAGPALHFFRGRGGAPPPHGFRPEAKSFVTGATGGDPPCDCSVVHYRNPPQRVAGPE